MPVRAHSSPRPNAPRVDKGFFANNVGPELTTVVKKDFAVDGCTAFAVESRGRVLPHLLWNVSHVVLSGSQGRFFFELSRRADAQGAQKSFVTYRGFEKGTPTGGNTVVVDVDSGKCVSRLRILRKSTSPIDKVGIKTSPRPFCAVHSSGGLLDLSAFDVTPDADADLQDMKLIVSRFVGDGHHETENSAEIDKKGFNVWAMKNGVDTFQQLLFLRRPVEKGQTVELTHGSILASFQNKGDYNHNMVETAVGLLSTASRGVLLSWLREESMKLCGTGNMATTWVTSRRLRWLATRASRMKRSNFNDESLAAIIKVCNELHIPPEHLPNYIDTTSKEIEREFLAFMDLDVRIGALARQRWFPFAQDFFGEIVSIMSKSSFIPAPDSLKEYIDSKLQAEQLSHFESLSFSCSKATTEFTENCSLELFETSNGKDLRDVIGCVLSTGEGEFDFLGVADFQEGKHSIAVQWYRSFLLNLFGEMMSAFTLYLANNSEKEVNLVPVLSELKLKWGTRGIARPFQPRYRPSVVFSHATPSCFPDSLPYFVDIVWPVMQDRGWAMVVGDDLSEIVFSPKQKKLEWTGYVKQQREERIEQSKSALVGMGFGNARKATKRLLIQASEIETASMTEGNHTSVLSVTQVLEKFSEQLSAKSPTTAQQGKIDLIIGQIGAIFDAFASRMGIAGASPGTNPCSTCQGYHLLEVLPMIPDIIRQVERPRKELHDALAVVQDLLGFIVAHHETLLPEPFHISPESYADLQQKLSSPLFNPMFTREALADEDKSEDSSSPEFGPMLTSGDSERLSDFMVCLLSNVRLELFRDICSVFPLTILSPGRSVSCEPRRCGEKEVSYFHWHTGAGVQALHGREIRGALLLFECGESDS